MLFNVTEDSTGRHAPMVTVSFDDSFITVYKEVRNLEWLGFKVPPSLTNLADDVDLAYVSQPFQCHRGGWCEVFLPYSPCLLGQVPICCVCEGFVEDDAPHTGRAAGGTAAAAGWVPRGHPAANHRLVRPAYHLEHEGHAQVRAEHRRGGQ